MIVLPAAKCMPPSAMAHHQSAHTRPAASTTTMSSLINIPNYLIITVITLLHLFCHFVNGLKLTRVDVPSIVVMGEPFWLNCSYDLQNEELYSIKWYHWNPDSNINGEFYRWLPKDSPPGQIFDSKGIHLDLRRSNLGNVYLIKSDIYTDGSFRCEVSAEAPNFQTVRKEKELHVYSPPRGKLTIDGVVSDISHYGPGDLINVTCHAKPSRPPAILTWYVNDELPEGRFVKNYHFPKRADGLEQVSAQLQFYSERAHYRNGLLKLRCISNIIQGYSVTSDEVVITDSQKYATPPESVGKETPIITGVKGNYRIGETVELTCICRAKPAPKLYFLINDEEAKPNQVRKYPVFPLSDGKIFASKLGLEFRIEPEDSGSLTPKRANRHYNNVLAKSGSNVAKQYRIKCVASMEKEIHTSEAQILLGTSKESSGLHFAGNGASSTITVYKWIFAVAVLIHVAVSTMP